ncbi:unnamed protein product [Cochlearia groenlandica]
MLKQESTWSQACDSAYLCCTNCVASCHERVRVCESCERAPAAFFCKADAASLCRACDSKVHSANPLARRHQRVPILPISGNSYSSMVTNHLSEHEDEAEAASWLLTSSGNNSGDNNHSHKNGFSIGEEYLGRVDNSSNMNKQFTDQHQYQQDYNVLHRSYGGDGVVPLQVQEPKQHDFQFGFTCVSSGAHEKSFNDSPSHMVHVSSMDLGVVPESTTSDTMVSRPKSPKAVTHQLPEPPAKMLSAMDREARVLRYREKKKMRKFEKTIRYASRKAYAERRPRIKGRFVKRKEVDAEADQALSTMMMFHTGYGVVPSF